MVFEFAENEYFTNKLIEKTYFISQELIAEKVVSTNIDWKEGKNYSSIEREKKMINKSRFIILNIETGEAKVIKVKDNIPSFFNFFVNIRLPNEEEILKINYETVL